MNIQQVGLQAYNTALRNFNKADHAAKTTQLTPVAPQQGKSFAETLGNSLEKVNTLHGHKEHMVQAFASGETQNVHELMIALQKAGLAMNLTAAVRNKVMEAYKELSRVQF